MVDRVGMLQIDSVNILARAHYLPGFSRLGPYPTALLDHAAWGRRRSLFEYWGHEASLLPLRLHPLLRWRMARVANGQGTYKHLAEFAVARKDYVANVLAEIRATGAMAAADLSNSGKARGNWWGWSDGKLAAEFLFASGEIAVAQRRGAFERVYDLTERVIPTAILSIPTPPEADAQRDLVRIAAAAMGVATAGDLARYFRLPPQDARARVAELVETGELLPVAVEGWKQAAFLSADARRPRRVDGCTLLSPFDPLLWERDRVERLFDFHYRIGLYTPAHLRVHGYYVLPFLLGERIVARVDLKADRATAVLQVLAAHVESHAAPGIVAAPLHRELTSLAAWLNLDRIEIAQRGDLAGALSAIPSGRPA